MDVRAKKYCDTNKTRSDHHIHYRCTSLCLQCNQAREQNFFISEFEPILAHKIRSIIDKNLKFGTNLLQHKLYIEFKLWDVTVITSIFMAS